MGKDEVEIFFRIYVEGFILADIKREIALAKSGHTVRLNDKDYPGAGNYLCALGLLAYTEFMGGIKEEMFEKQSHDLFNSFLYQMGEQYRVFDHQLSATQSLRNPNRPLSVWEVFRCGMVHEYFLKQSGVIAMLEGQIYQFSSEERLRFTLSPPTNGSRFLNAQQGLGLLDDGRYFFIVERYLRDFEKACDDVRESILRMPKPSLPSGLVYPVC